MALGFRLKLKNASVLVVGAGGLGCPALQYLATAGIGILGIVDHDTVELSNLQRQILHTDRRIGWPKTLSAAAAINELNPGVKVKTYAALINSSNAISIVHSYSVVLDCTDNPATRYLLSDVTCALGIPLVSGAAMRYDGQLCALNLGGNWPCYRCLFPKPPSADSISTCEDSGVLGVVTGVIGTLQAMEAIKIITGINSDADPTLLIFSAQYTPMFRTVKLRRKRPLCLACGGGEGNARKMIEETDYESFCGRSAHSRRNMNSRDRLTPMALSIRLREARTPVSVIDVRPSHEFGICHLPGSTNLSVSAVAELAPELVENHQEIYVVCRTGNDSQIAGLALLEAAHATGNTNAVVKDVVGGLVRWHQEVDQSFPVY